MPQNLSLKARALRHLARREHTRAELERKLRAAVRGAARAEGAAPNSEGADEPPDESQLAEQIGRALDELTARGLLDDGRAAESLLASQGARLGQRRLRQVLQARGLAPELVRETLAQSSATEFERARDLWRRRFGETPADAKAAARQMRFLAGRGFDTEIIRRVLKDAPGPDADD